MRKLGASLVAIVAVGAVAVAPSVAQDLPDTSIKVNAKVTPKNAGTKKNPQGVTLSGTVNWTTEAGFEPPVITGADVLIGKGGKYNGGKYPRCSAKTLKRDGGAGLKYCPKKSIMGNGTGVALADTVETKPKVVFVNGGAKEMYFYTTLFHPAFVQEPVIAKISKPGGKYAYRVRLKVPENLQIVAGVPIALKQFKYKIGGKKYAKDYFVTTSCPKGGYSFNVKTFYQYNDGSTSDSSFADKVPCTK
jgi:hypothetical protein